MIIIFSPSNIPYFNIASEEYLIKDFSKDILLFYVNNPAIIVGKHQNTLSEINSEYVNLNNIAVVRRLSGGGAVYHDKGNLNFSFITNHDAKHSVDFVKFTQPVINCLRSLGINACFEGRNDLTIDGKKFSGNASHIYKNRICHHGTILFDSNLSVLSDVLKPGKEKFQDKAIKSVRSRVTNVIDHLINPISIDQLSHLIINQVELVIKEAEDYFFNDSDIKSINKLVDEKYNTWQWNYGTSPSYNFTKSLKTHSGTIQSYMLVNKGIIQDVSIFGDYFDTKKTEDITNELRGVGHNESAIRLALDKFDIGEYFLGFSLDDVIDVLM